ncbi:MAG: hypothetical protein ACMG6E_09085 [Candidatus Roizmanbacteria bacterium]
MDFFEGGLSFFDVLWAPHLINVRQLEVTVLEMVGLAASTPHYAVLVLVVILCFPSSYQLYWGGGDIRVIVIELIGKSLFLSQVVVSVLGLLLLFPPALLIYLLL